MRRLQPLDPAEAPGKSSELLGDIVRRHGSAGTMVRTMAHSPALLQGYLDLSKAMKHIKLPRSLSERISLALQEWIGCGTCLVAHTRGGRAAGLTDTDISLARQGTATDVREAALLSFGVRVLVEPASITDEEVAELRAHGWSDRVIAEVVGLVALNLLTGAFNLVSGNQPDATEPGGE